MQREKEKFSDTIGADMTAAGSTFGSECVTLSEDLSDFFLNTVDFGDKALDSVVDLCVGLYNLLEDLQVELAWRRSVVVIRLDELVLCLEGCVLLHDMSVTLFLVLLDFACLDDRLL